MNFSPFQVHYVYIAALVTLFYLIDVLESLVPRYYLHQPEFEATLLEYGGRQALLHHFPGDPKGLRPSAAPPFIAIVGYVMGEFRRERKEGVPVTEVEVITDLREREEITTILRVRGERKPVNFWEE